MGSPGFSLEEWELLTAVAVGGEVGHSRISTRMNERHPQPGATVQVRVSGCAYSCCSRGWRRRDGYEQVYFGYVDNLTDRTFMLYRRGVGTMSYVVAVRFDELLEIELR